MDRRRGLTHPGTAQQAPGVGLDDHDLATRRAADVHRAMRFQPGRRKILSAVPAQQPVVDESLRHFGGTEIADLGIFDRQLCCSTKQLATK